LLFDRRDLVAPFLGFGLDDANCFLSNEKDIVGRADIGLVLANGDPKPGTEIDGHLVLNNPAGFLQMFVDLIAGNLFRVAVRSQTLKRQKTSDNSIIESGKPT
jgi:hypothetical protein